MAGATLTRKLSFSEKAVNVFCVIVLLAILCFGVFWLRTVIYLFSQGNGEGIFWGIIVLVTFPVIAYFGYEADLIF